MIEFNRLARRVAIGLMFLCGLPLAAQAGTYSLLHEFSSVDGEYPFADVILGPDSMLYGTANSGGEGEGTVFRLGEAGFELLASFNGTNGSSPEGGLTLANGEIWGTTVSGGAVSRGCRSGCGTAYRLSAEGEIENLASFDSELGPNPFGLTLGPDGAFYGVTSAGGAEGYGAVFRLAADGTLETVHLFTGGEGGFTPFDRLLLASDGAFYGTTYYGGLYGQGTVFRIRDGVFERVHSFDGSNGANPSARLVEIPGEQIVGTTQSGGPNGLGVVYRLSETKGYKVLHPFSYESGCNPQAGVALDADGWLYGTAPQGGEFGAGVIYRLKLNGKYKVLHHFGEGNDGRIPTAPLTIAPDGSFYGTTNQGGAFGFGTVFRYVR